MTRRTRDVSRAILERRHASGLGVGCSDAQADGIPCDVPGGDCATCRRATLAPGVALKRRPLSRRRQRRS